MKKLAAIVLLSFVYRQSLPAELLNFKNIIYSSRVGTFLDQHMTKSAGVYTTILSFSSDDATELLNVNAGYLKDLNSSDGSPLLEIGLRLDNLLARSISSPWGVRHITLAELPTLEFGPFMAMKTRRKDAALKLDFLYGLGLAIGF